MAPAAVDVRGWGWRHGGRQGMGAARASTCSSSPASGCCCSGRPARARARCSPRWPGCSTPPTPARPRARCCSTVGRRGPARARAGLVLQDPEAALVMARAGDDVAFGLENRGVATDEIWVRVDEALRAVGFPYPRDTATGALSGGEQQRLALAGILALRPGLLLLDEVTANLDPDGVALVRSVPRPGARRVRRDGSHRRAPCRAGRRPRRRGPWCLNPAAACWPTARRREVFGQRARRWRRAACGCPAGIPSYAGGAQRLPGPPLVTADGGALPLPRRHPRRAAADRPHGARRRGDRADGGQRVRQVDAGPDDGRAAAADRRRGAGGGGARPAASRRGRCGSGAAATW